MTRHELITIFKINLEDGNVLSFNKYNNKYERKSINFSEWTEFYENKENQIIFKYLIDLLNVDINDDQLICDEQNKLIDEAINMLNEYYTFYDEAYNDALDEVYDFPNIQ